MKTIAGALLCVLCISGCMLCKDAGQTVSHQLRPETKEDWIELATIVLEVAGGNWEEGLSLVGEKLEVDLLNPTEQSLDVIRLWSEVMEELAGRNRGIPTDPRVQGVFEKFYMWKLKRSTIRYNKRHEPRLHTA